MDTLNVNSHLVHLHQSNDGDDFLSVSVPPNYKGAAWGSFCVPLDALTDGSDKNHVGIDLTGIDKVYVRYKAGDTVKTFSYKPETIIARMQPRPVAEPIPA